MLTKPVGRPRRSIEPSSEVVGLRLTPTEKERLDHFCFIYEQSPSELVRSTLDLLDYI